jgi:CBS domain-containing protein
MVEMINRGFRHVPVVSARNEVVGVVTDIDLLAADTRTPFTVRRRIARAEDLDDLVLASRDLRATLIALHEADVSATQLTAIIAAFADAITRRALELLVKSEPRLPSFAWLATGSMGRHEAFVSSDVDSAIVWEQRTDPGDEAQSVTRDPDGELADGERMRAIAAQVHGALARCRFATDEHAATAAHALFARSATGWRDALNRYLDHPEDTRLPIVVSVVADSHAIYTRGVVSDAFAELDRAYRHPVFMDTLRRMALDHKPPTGFLRDIVVEGSGEHRGLLDIKRGGFLPIVSLARYLALITGTAATGTVDRLRAAAVAGACPASDATDLIEAFELFSSLRMDHQIGQLRAGEEPTDYIDPSDLSPLVRRYLRDAFRAIAGAQRRLPQPDHR